MACYPDESQVLAGVCFGDDLGALAEISVNNAGSGYTNGCAILQGGNYDADICICAPEGCICCATILTPGTCYCIGECYGLGVGVDGLIYVVSTTGWTCLGLYVEPNPDEVLTTGTYGCDCECVGTVSLPDECSVAEGVCYGPADACVGTLVASTAGGYVMEQG